ncbi:MAG: DUF177 domain-containing protein [Pseudomonadota bacterium]
MKVSVIDIPEEGLALHVELSGEVLDGAASVKGPILVDIKIEKSGRNVRVRGGVKASMVLSCSRCGEEFTWPLESDFDQALIIPVTGDHADRELSPEELDVSFFDGETVDVERVAAEQIFLQLPYKPLCREDCKGLCPRCGINLNHGSCSCAPKANSSPFALLKEVKTQKNDKEKQ